MKFLNSYDYTLNPVFFIISLQGSHFGSMESIPISRQNCQSSKETMLDTFFFFFRFLCFIFTYSKGLFIFITDSFPTAYSLCIYSTLHLTDEQYWYKQNQLITSIILSRMIISLKTKMTLLYFFINHYHHIKYILLYV